MDLEKAYDTIGLLEKAYDTGQTLGRWTLTLTNVQ